MDRRTHGQTGRRAHVQTDRQTDRQIDRRTNKTGLHTHKHGYCICKLQNRPRGRQTQFCFQDFFVRCACCNRILFFLESLSQFEKIRLSISSWCAVLDLHRMLMLPQEMLTHCITNKHDMEVRASTSCGIIAAYRKNLTDQTNCTG